MLPDLGNVFHAACAMVPRILRRLARLRRPQPVLFDRAYYLSQNPDVAKARADPLTHYFEHGWREGRNPHPLFDSTYYLEQNPDVTATGENPFLHFMRHGAKEGRNPHPLFDSTYYLEQNPDLAANGGNPFLHFMSHGPREGRNPHPLFDTKWYLAENPDVAANGINPLVHFLQYGYREGRDPNPFFDTDWYLAFYLALTPDIAVSKRNPLVHYITIGAAKGFNPSPHFNGSLYLNQNPDVALSGVNPLLHYILHSAEAGRHPYPPASGESQKLAAPYQAQSASVRETTTRAPSSRPIEPAIKPPPLAAIADLSALELCLRSAEIVSAVRSLRAKNHNFRNGDRFSAAQETPQPNKMNLKLNPIRSDGGISAQTQRSAPREALARTGVDPWLEEMIMGLGITPSRTINDKELPNYPVPILQRYNRGRLEATRRFVLDPSRAGTKHCGPTISILMPAYNTPVVFLERAILSVLFQTSSKWELLIVDDGSTKTDVENILRYYTTVDKRIKTSRFESNRGISAATNAALSMASGAYIGLLDADDMLTRDALEKIAGRLNEDDRIDLVYSDECTIDTDDVADSLFHKPDWSPILLLNFMYTGHLSVYRKALIARVGCFRSEFDFSQDYDLALRVSEQQPKVSHIEECLYGWRMIAGSASVGDKPDARLSNIAALQAAADRRGYGGVAIALPTANRLKRPAPGKRPLVSIVVPSAGKLNRVKATAGSIKSLTTYRNYELIFVTGSEFIEAYGTRLASPNTHFAPYDKAFNFSDKCNIGAARAKGDYVIFLNDDVLVISPDWIETILECLTLPGVGGVSPKLIYENGTIQYAGLVTGVRRLVGTAFHCYPAQTTAYVNMAQSVREVSILSGACLAMPMRLFNEIGGWNAHNTQSAHSDCDLCFRIREHGYSCVYTPHAELTHIGHVEIGADEAAAKKKTKTLKKDKSDIFMLKRWGCYFERDPYFPPKMRDLVYIDSQEEFIFEKSRIQVGSKSGKDFILFTHDLSASGAPRCLYEVARVLIEAGHYVLLMSPEDGRFRKRYVEIGVDVIVDPLALSGHEAVIDLARNFDVAICNTIICWRVPGQIAPYMPVYLYSMETELVGHFRDNVPGFCEGLAAATAIWAPGPYCASKIREYCGLEALSIESCVEELPDLPDDDDDYPGEVVIALVGTYEARKGQDMAVDGFNMLPSELQIKSRLVMAGRTNDAPFRVDAEKRAHSHIVFHNELDYLQVVRLIRRADIMLVPSRDDGGPTTAIDALGAGKILVISATSGISQYVVDGESGFILRDNGPEDICATLCRVFERKSRWPTIKAKARELYEAHFTRQRFKERLLHALGPGERENSVVEHYQDRRGGC
jgi:O-antigen biosynthesis protein